ncbi:TPA: hypothetical protein MH573_07545 [Klebsiella pneumoniae]|nr:hypothetical protein CWN56_29415 [Klebsiella pneumoniae]HBX5791792.1 hypothetical protein [Klebsiella pneumoniae]HBX6052618.1 hypothetical protein [Klebsiella pneumoniae]
MVFVLLTFMVESMFAFDGLIISLLTITCVAKSAIYITFLWRFDGVNMIVYLFFNLKTMN